jgi:catechol 2,3-dioxygenase-like lactoylglutathione lyase family enzyme
MSPVGRHIDHVVVAVHDLAAAGAFYRRLGFQVGARSRHSWGTEKRLISFASSFTDRLRPATILPPSPSIGPPFQLRCAFVRDYLRDRQGLAMLAPNSDDATADAALFAACGI